MASGSIQAALRGYLARHLASPDVSVASDPDRLMSTVDRSGSPEAYDALHEAAKESASSLFGIRKERREVDRFPAGMVRAAAYEALRLQEALLEAYMGAIQDSYEALLVRASGLPDRVSEFLRASGLKSGSEEVDIPVQIKMMLDEVSLGQSWDIVRASSQDLVKQRKEVDEDIFLKIEHRTLNIES